MNRRFNPFLRHPPLRCYPSPTWVRETSILEIGPGRGDFLFELARAHAGCRVAAVEIKRKRYEKLKPRLKRLAIENVCLINGDARVVLPVLLRPQQIEACYILFSDPWPKDRHEKHRLFQSYFVHELARIMKPGGELTIAHDDEQYLAVIKNLFSRHPAFKPIDRLTHRPIDPFQTFYAEKWRQEGRTLQACRYSVNEISELDFERSATESKWHGYARWHEEIDVISDM